MCRWYLVGKIFIAHDRQKSDDDADDRQQLNRGEAGIPAHLTFEIEGHDAAHGRTLFAAHRSRHQQVDKSAEESSYDKGNKKVGIELPGGQEYRDRQE